MSDDLRINKYAAAILATALVGIGAQELSSELFHTDLPEKPGYRIDVASNDTAGSHDETHADNTEIEIDFAALMAGADPAAGAKVARKCTACHDFVSGGEIKQGPPLWNVVGRDIASYAGFQYSEALSGWGDKWDYQALFTYLERPSRAVPGTAMNFIGLRKPEDRINLIAWLRSRADEPHPLP